MSTDTPSNGVSRAVALLGMIVTFLGGFLIGSITGDWRKPQLEDAKKADRTHVPVDFSPAAGPRQARVTIVEFADFQCGYCSRSVTLAHQILSDYKGQVRWVFKHYPMGFHRRASAAAQASMAAHAQGRFWEYHDMLFANRRKLGDADLVNYARRTGLDLNKFREAMRTKTYEKVVNLDRALAQKLGIKGTPTFFINGRKKVGSMSYRKLKKMINQELAYAQYLVQEGVAPDKIYEAVTRKDDEGKSSDKAGKDKTGKDKAGKDKAAKPQARGPAAQGTIYQIRPGKSPFWGASDAVCTVIMFGDYRCENTARVYGGLKELRKVFGDERLKVVYKQFPLRRHRQVKVAARAALAAHDQGKFWPYHERLMQQNTDISQEGLVRLARELGLDADRFIADLNSDRFAAKVRADHQLGLQFGTNATPSLFINGRFVRSAQTTAQLRDKIVAELKRATDALRSGVSRKELYEHLIKNGKKSA